MTRRSKRTIPELNTTSTADISFMLLILFLVATSMDIDQGITRLLAPVNKKEVEQEKLVDRRNIMEIELKADNSVTINQKKANLNDLNQLVADFIENADNRSDMPEKVLKKIPLLGKCAVTDKHVIRLQVSREAAYNRYFAIQNELMVAYNTLRNRLARAKFGYDYESCTDEQRKAILQVYPLRIAEKQP
ncbi:MAG: biopolymer transporter ExbD [Prevotellaceae bacterium]|nr:biopolymer transporter ExbD [Prevotella sp.]MDD7529434.1 biopolymer transporter ExbD [Prevotellaceae bacterium]MDY2633875.1 biopolymer transporter ExbD [Prevotella sp.]